MAADARARLDAWRASGADQVDPVRFRLMEALARRSAGHQGAARRLLDERLHGLVAAYDAIVQRDAGKDGDAADSAAPSRPAASALGALVHDITARTKPGITVASNDAPSRAPVPAHASQPDAPLVDSL